MKNLKLLITLLFTSTLLTSCVVVDDRTVTQNYQDSNQVTLNELIHSYDLWYVDIHKKQGTAKVPFVERAFTITFNGGTLYGNNNIVDIGKTGNGYGIKIGNYTVYNEVIATSHRQGASDFRVTQISANEISLQDVNQNITYYLVGYQKNDFDYDKLFYDNIEYFLQEFVAWERIKYEGGQQNAFDQEHYLQFTPENETTFRSSKDNFGMHIDNIRWDYVGNYEIADYNNVDNIKHLTLFYRNSDKEEFDLSVINDETIRLHHLGSKTNYDFAGKGFIQYLKSSTATKQSKNRKNNRERKKIARKKMIKNI